MTVAKAVAALVDALAQSAFEHNDDGSLYFNAVAQEHCCGRCGKPVSTCDKRNARDPDRNCPGQADRAALACWRERPRLRDDAAVAQLLEDFVTETQRIGTSWIVDRQAFLDALEDHLFGPRETGDAPPNPGSKETP